MGGDGEDWRGDDADEWPRPAGRTSPPRGPRRRPRWSTRALMIATAVIGVDMAVVAQAAHVGATVEFTLFIGAVMGTLNLFFLSYLQAADRMNAAPPERQTEMVVTLGCLLAVMMALLVPVVIVILVMAQG